MLKKTSPLFSLIFLCFLIILLLGLWIAAAKADNLSSLQSRVSRLESDNYRLRSRLNHLESQLKRGSLSSSLDNQEPVRLPSSSSAPSIEKQMFDRLATLVIELKERVKDLELRVDALEKSPAI
jgi:outer membrane murein-binding lipoprotein Lpp